MQNVQWFLRAKKQGRKMVFLTCYDYAFARVMDQAKLDGILVGDSLGEVLYDMKNTQHVPLGMILAHTEAVCRGIKNTHVMGDMPRSNL